MKSVQANFESTETSDPGTCPINHKMYYVGNNPLPPSIAAYSPKATPKTLSWNTGTLSDIFTFSDTSGSVVFRLSFSNVRDIYLGNNRPRSPFFGSLTGVTTSAINMSHTSSNPKVNHILDISVNRPVSKIGYKIQDLDSTTSSRRVPYIEQADVSADQGRLTFNSNFHTRNASQDVVTARSGRNCAVGACTIDASWGYNIADVLLNMKHSNTFSRINRVHSIGYSEFYFCLAPPKLIVQKQLNGNRVNNNDQFRIEVTGGSIAANEFTTTGTDSTVNDNSSSTLSLRENTTYTITEQLINSTMLADIANYNATYTCNNATTGSTTNVPSGTMTYNAAEGTRSFILDNTAYGDEITCTITNSPNYVFSGIVFNDNGGIAASSTTRQDISSTFAGNPSYFNAAFDSATESGIYDASMNIRLTDCNGTSIAIATTSSNPQPVSNTQATRGQYNFVVPASALTNRTRVCVVQDEPSAWDYNIDTTPNTREVTLVNGVFNYKTESNGSRNLDFGEVKDDNAALVLVKSQYVHTCSDTLDYQNVGSSENPTLGFSINPISDVDPGNCIAYRIQAYNRGHVGLQQVQISDTIQSTPVVSVFKRPAPLFTPTSVASPSVAYDTNGEIQSNLFSLAAAINQPSSATLYFNTKYGTTQSN